MCKGGANRKHHARLGREGKESQRDLKPGNLNGLRTSREVNAGPKDRMKLSAVAGV